MSPSPAPPRRSLTSATRPGAPHQTRHAGAATRSFIAAPTLRSISRSPASSPGPPRQLPCSPRASSLGVTSAASAWVTVAA